MSSYEPLFSDTIAVPEQLTEHICAQIVRIERRAAIIRATSTGAISVLFGISFFPIFSLLRTGITEGGFMSYLQLMFSDGDVFLSNWSTFTLSLLESFPLLWFTALTGIAFVLLWSLRYTVKHIRVALLVYRLA